MERILTNDQPKGFTQTIANVANTALEYGLKAILPDFIENDVIEVKDRFIEYGFTEGVQEVFDKLEDVGKSITGIFTGEFETVEQVKRVVQTNGILDGISDVIDKVLKILVDKEVINKTTSKLIKQGKKEILNTVEKELEGVYKETTYSLDKLEENCDEWRKAYKKKDYNGMEKAMKKISQKLKQNKAVEEAINEAKNLEKIQKYIEESGNIENLTESEKELLEKIK